jgi:alpha-mannosidase
MNKIQQRNMTFMYSNPSTFLDAVHSENITFPVFNYDFFPYYEELYEFWTGFYTTRPGMKKQAKSYT